MSISSNELRELYQQYFESKGHARIPSAPLVPENDPSVLFTTAGMHPLVPYLQGEVHPQGRRLTNVQKCLRTTDIEAVGDATHATVFEMLGNWSLGDYFKKDAIAMSWEFLTGGEWLGLSPDRLAVSVFAGDEQAPRDEESAQIWQQIGLPEERIAYLDKHENWWPAGGGETGPQGPDTEMFYWTGEDRAPKKFDPEDTAWVEIWNDVFMQYNGDEHGKLSELPRQNVDTGMGLERVVMVLNHLPSIYDIDTYEKLMGEIRSRSQHEDVRHQRILADHIKAAAFVLADEHPVVPANKEHGYVLRRIIRRAMRSARELGIEPLTILTDGLEYMVSAYADVYPSLEKHQTAALAQLEKEVAKFEAALETGQREFEKLLGDGQEGDAISGEAAFKLYDTYGFPIELTRELAGEHKRTIDMGGFEEALKRHQATSRGASQGKFAGGLADHSTKSVQYHTATHLLHQALRNVLGDHVLQRGSNITTERLRFDFSHPEKLTKEEIAAVEAEVNQQIAADLAVKREELSVAAAKERGALGLFEEKYGEMVSVYSIGDYSMEICGGPHVEHTSELGDFAITKEESAGSGIRRIKAELK